MLLNPVLLENEISLLKSQTTALGPSCAQIPKFLPWRETLLDSDSLSPACSGIQLCLELVSHKQCFELSSVSQHLGHPDTHIPRHPD